MNGYDLECSVFATRDVYNLTAAYILYFHDITQNIFLQKYTFFGYKRKSIIRKMKKDSDFIIIIGKVNGNAPFWDERINRFPQSSPITLEGDRATCHWKSTISCQELKSCSLKRHKQSLGFTLSAISHYSSYAYFLPIYHVNTRRKGYRFSLTGINFHRHHQYALQIVNITCHIKRRDDFK